MRTIPPLSSTSTRIHSHDLFHPLHSTPLTRPISSTSRTSPPITQTPHTSHVLIHTLPHLSPHQSLHPLHLTTHSTLSTYTSTTHHYISTTHHTWSFPSSPLLEPHVRSPPWLAPEERGDLGRVLAPPQHTPDARHRHNPVHLIHPFLLSHTSSIYTTTHTNIHNSQTHLSYTHIHTSALISPSPFIQRLFRLGGNSTISQNHPRVL